MIDTPDPGDDVRHSTAGTTGRYVRYFPNPFGEGWAGVFWYTLPGEPSGPGMVADGLSLVAPRLLEWVRG